MRPFAVCAQKIIPVEFGDRLEMNMSGFRIGKEDDLFWLTRYEGKEGGADKLVGRM